MDGDLDEVVAGAAARSSRPSSSRRSRASARVTKAFAPAAGHGTARAARVHARRRRRPASPRHRSAVMRYIGDGAVSDGASGRRGRDRAHPGATTSTRARASGTSPRRDDGRFVGWVSLKYAGDAPDIEIGYRLLPEAWGQGYRHRGREARWCSTGSPILGLGTHHRRHAPGQPRVAARAAEGRDARRGLGPLLRPRPAAVRHRARHVAGSRMSAGPARP